MRRNKRGGIVNVIGAYVIILKNINYFTKEKPMLNIVVILFLSVILSPDLQEWLYIY